MVGHVIPLSAKEALISMPSGIYKLAFETQALQFISELEPHLPNNRPNDGKCDPQGRLWVGTIDLEFKKGASSLYRLEHNGDLTQVLSGLTLANGLAWDINKNLFYFIDSDTACIQRFDYHPETGDITNGVVAFKYDKALGLPDGMCIDPEGMLWIAGFNGGQVSRFNPNTGKILQTIKLPTPYTTSCTLGGKHLNQLFITSASHLLTAEEKKLDKQSGLTFMVELF
jgi:sugar lactone lactonase YvrE